jgi:ankyrin repeat protein
LVEEGGGDVNAKRNDGSTVLHWAACCGRLDVVKWLVEEGGGNVNAKDNDGKTALDRANEEWLWESERVKERKRDVVEWLEKWK